MREVDHRAMNLLGVIQSIVQLTRADSLPSFIEAVTGRIEALGRTHSLLASIRWEGAELSTPRGHIAAIGTIEQQQGSGDLLLCWAERGGHAVETPSRSGFGA